jgi:recombination protein RecT
MATQALTKFSKVNFGDYVKTRKNELKQAAASDIDLSRLYRLMLHCVSTTPALQQCTVPSIFRVMSQAAQVGLEPGTALGQCYIVPYKDQAQFIIGYRGYVELARRSGQVTAVSASAVYSEDEFYVERGTADTLKHIPKLTGPRGTFVFAYAVAKLANGAIEFDFMSKEEIDAIRGRSRAGTSGPWVTDYIEMAKKTVVRRLAKLLPMSIEAARAVEIDEEADFGPFGATVRVQTGEITEDPIEDDITDSDEQLAEPGSPVPEAGAVKESVAAISR